LEESVYHVKTELINLFLSALVIPVGFISSKDSGFLCLDLGECLLNAEIIILIISFVKLVCTAPSQCQPKVFNFELLNVQELIEIVAELPDIQ
jgi:hypothetical protein